MRSHIRYKSHLRYKMTVATFAAAAVLLLLSSLAFSATKARSAYSAADDQISTDSQPERRCGTRPAAMMPTIIAATKAEALRAPKPSDAIAGPGQ